MATNPFPPRCQERFRLDKLVARGGFGRVYRAYQIGLDRPVAVKILDASVLENEEDVARFKLEARITASLKHAHIVIVIDHDVEDGLPWIAYEFLPGMNLRDRLIEQGTLKISTVLAVGIQVASALSEAHAHDIFHRDIKPDNIQEVDAERFKVTDFGIAKWGTHGAIRTQAGIIVGTPAYLAPEQIRSQPVTQQTDLYSLGIVLYELLTGRPPFDGELPIHTLHQHLKEPPPPIRAIRPDCPASLDGVIRRALEKHPGDRHAGAAAMQRALETVLDEHLALGGDGNAAAVRSGRQSTIATVRVDRQDRSNDAPVSKVKPPPPRRARTGWVTLAGIALVAGLGAAYALRPVPPEPAPSPTAAPSPVETPSTVASPALDPKLTAAERAARETSATAIADLEARCTRALDALTEAKSGNGQAAASKDYAAVLSECAVHGQLFLGAAVLPDVQGRFLTVVERLLAAEWGSAAQGEREQLGRRILDWKREAKDHWLPRAMVASIQERAGDLGAAADSRALALGLFQQAVESAPGDARVPPLWKQLADGAMTAAAATTDAQARFHGLALGHREWVLKLDRERKLSTATALHREIEQTIRALLAPPPLKPEELRSFTAAGDLEQRLAALHERGPDGLAEARTLARNRMQQVRGDLVERRGRALGPAVVDFLLEEAVLTATALVKWHAPDPGRLPPTRRPQDPPPPGAPELVRTIDDLSDLASLVLSPPIPNAAALGPSAQDQFAEAACLLLRPQLKLLDDKAFQQHALIVGDWLREYPEAWSAWFIEGARCRAAGDLPGELSALSRALALITYEYIAPPGGKPNPRAMRPWTTVMIALLDCAHRKTDPALVEALVIGFRTRAVALQKAGLLAEQASRRVEEVIARVRK